MRYTTIIDITDNSKLWRNDHLLRLYYWLVCKCGYHDDDRDIIKLSIADISAATRLTVSAVRNGLKQLTTAGLLTKLDGGGYKVTKWIPTPDQPKPRAQRPKSCEADNQYAERLQRERQTQIDEYRKQLSAAVMSMTVEELEQWLSELQAGRSTRHKDVYLRANKQSTEWLCDYINKRKSMAK